MEQQLVASRVMGRHQHHFLGVLLLLAVWLGSSQLQVQVNAQQQYGNTQGYFCSDSGKKSCSTFALYRAQGNYSTVPQIAKLFNTTASTVAKLNKLSASQSLDMGKAVIIPVTCRCGANSTSFASIPYKIVKGDTFYKVNVNNFESLSTTTEVLAANSKLDPYNLQIGQVIVFPLRCACPSTAQTSKGVKSLVTYPVAHLDTVGAIASSFGVSSGDVINANTLTGVNSQINEQTTLVIPINSSQPSYTYVAPAPVAAPSPLTSSDPSASSGGGGGGGSSKTGIYVAIAIGVCAAILILAGLAGCVMLALKHKRKRDRRKEDFEAPLVRRKDGAAIGGSSPGSGLSNYNSPYSPSPHGKSSSRSSGADPLSGMADFLGTDKPTLYSYQDLCDATNNFSESSKLQGSVYRGVLKDGHVVAIKQMKGNVSQELRILCRVHHTNLVRLVGLCSKEAEYLYLVYEYAENGSLNDCLHTDYLSRKNKLSTQSSTFLSWTMRVQVALDVASGLEYIHDYVNPSYVHKDVKSSNILLDSAFRAKIANFAMAKSGGANNDLMTRHIAGTYGYMAPEYLAHGLVTTKADVFSFGVVLLELMSGKEAIISEDAVAAAAAPADGGGEGVVGGEEQRCLYSAIRPVLESENPQRSLKEWMDPTLENNYPSDTALNMASIAKSCVDMDPALRPGMKDITFALSKVLNASLEWEASSVFANTLAGTPIEGR